MMTDGVPRNFARDGETMDQELQTARRSATTPREKFELMMLELRAGNNPGLTLAFDDTQANNAAKAGERITLNLQIGDLVLVERNNGIIGAFLAAIIEVGNSRAVIVDKLDADFSGFSDMLIYLCKTDKIVVWRRNGKIV